MKRFLAVLAAASFLAACSESTTVPRSLQQAHVASQDGIPPPPPLTGSGDGELDLGSFDLSTNALTTLPTDPCLVGHAFSLNYSWSYLEPDPNNQQVVHLALDGSPTNGEIILHQNQNGKSNAQGSISDGSFSFNLQSGDVITLTSSGFDFEVTGILTNLETGDKCTISGNLSGVLAGEVPE